METRVAVIGIIVEKKESKEIVNDNGNVEFDDVTECEITYHISGKPGFDKLGPRQDALESFVRKSSNNS